jgi:hypothetical protein
MSERVEVGDVWRVDGERGWSEWQIASGVKADGCHDMLCVRVYNSHYGVGDQYTFKAPSAKDGWTLVQRAPAVEAPPCTGCGGFPPRCRKCRDVACNTRREAAPLRTVQDDTCAGCWCGAGCHTCGPAAPPVADYTRVEPDGSIEVRVGSVSMRIDGASTSIKHDSGASMQVGEPRPKRPAFRADLWTAVRTHIKHCRADVRAGDLVVFDGMVVHTLECGTARWRDAARGYEDAMASWQRVNGGGE